MNKIRKIPLEELINTLNEIHNCGVDFIDISGKNTHDEDSINISFLEEYINPEYKEYFFENMNIIKDDEENITIKKLTDDDLNQLM